MKTTTIHHACSLALVAFAVGCGGDRANTQPAASGPELRSATAPPPRTAPDAHETTPSARGDLLAQLKDSKLTLAQGIEEAQTEHGPATSAKFELEHGKLALSVYTATAGLDKDAEHNVLMELIGDPTKEKWSPKSEVFEDKAHITRASTHLTLVQRAKTTLSAVVAKATARQPGTAYSITPVVKDRKPAFDVLIATPDGKSTKITIEAS